MGVVSNGMLCSGDELRLTARCATASSSCPPTRRSACRSPTCTATSSSMSTSSPTAATPCQPRRPGPRGGRRDRRAGPLPRDRAAGDRRDPIDERLQVEVRDAELCPRFVGRWVSGVTVGPSPDRVQMRLIAAGQRPVSNVVDVSNYVMLELGKPIHTFDAARGPRRRRSSCVRRAAGRADRDARPRRPRARPRDAAHRGPGRAPRDRRRHGRRRRRRSPTRPPTSSSRSAIFDPVSIRRTAFRYALRSEASLRFEKGQEHRLAQARRRPHGAAHQRVGRRNGRDGRRRHRSARARAAARRLPAGPRRPAPGHAMLATDEQRALLARVGIATEPAPAGTRIAVAAGSAAARDRPGRCRGAGRDRADLAARPRRSRPTSPKRSPASAATSSCPPILPHTPMPPYRHRPARRPRRGPRDARGRRRDRGRHLRPRLAGDGRAVPAGRRARTVAGRGEPGGRPVAVTNPLSSQHSVMRQSCSAASWRSSSTNLRHGRDDVAIFEVGKGYGAADGDAHARVVAARLRAHGRRREPPAWNRPARPYDLDDAKGLIELARAGASGSPRRRTRRSTDDPNLHPGPCGRGRRRRTALRRPGRRAASGAPGRARAARPTGHRRRDRDRRAVRWPADVPRGATPIAPSGRRARPGGRRRGRRARGDGRRPSIARHGGPLLRRRTLFDIYRGRPLADDEQSLAFRLRFQAPDRTLTEAEIDAAVAAITAGLAATSTAASGPDRTGPPRPAVCDLATRRRPLLPLRRPEPPAPGVMSTRRSVDIGTFLGWDHGRPAPRPVLHGFFVLGFAQGTIRRLIGIASILFSFFFAANLSSRWATSSAENWTQFSPEYST